MFDTESYSTEDLPPIDAIPDVKEHQWRTWVAKEMQKRVLLAHYMLDGLNAQMSGEATSERHVSSQLHLPSDDAAFEATSADEWLSQMHSQRTERTSFRTVFRLLFSEAGEQQVPGASSSAFSFKVILEGLQSLLPDSDDEGEVAFGMPSKQDMRKALLRVHHSVLQSVDLSSEDRLETLLRWHSVCLDTLVKTASLCRSVCSRYGIEQHIWTCHRRAGCHVDLAQWAGTTDARRALLHAIAIQDIVEQLPRGRAHAIHMPSSLFAAATVYSVFSLAGVNAIQFPSMIDWKQVLYLEDQSSAGIAELADLATNLDTTHFIKGEYVSTRAMTATSRNLLYELNSMQKLFGCLSTQWGVSADMESVVAHWISLCH